MLNIAKLSNFCGRKNEKSKIKSEIEGEVYNIPVNKYKYDFNIYKFACQLMV